MSDGSACVIISRHVAFLHAIIVEFAFSTANGSFSFYCVHRFRTRAVPFQPVTDATIWNHFVNGLVMYWAIQASLCKCVVWQNSHTYIHKRKSKPDHFVWLGIIVTSSVMLFRKHPLC